MTNRVRYFRFINKEMTQAELAGKVAVSRQTIVAIEKGNYSPSVELALQLARVFQVPVEQLFQLEGEGS